MTEYTKAGIMAAVCADILNDIEKEVVNEGFYLAADKVHDIVQRMTVVRDALAKTALDEGIPSEMIYRKVSN